MSNLSHTYTNYPEEVPEFFLPFHLHLHHCWLTGFYVLNCCLQLGDQINDATFAHKNCAVKQTQATGSNCLMTPRTSCLTGELVDHWMNVPQVVVQVLQHFVLVLNCLQDDPDHVRAVTVSMWRVTLCSHTKYNINRMLLGLLFFYSCNDFLWCWLLHLALRCL